MQIIRGVEGAFRGYSTKGPSRVGSDLEDAEMDRTFTVEVIASPVKDDSKPPHATTVTTLLGQNTTVDTAVLIEFSPDGPSSESPLNHAPKSRCFNFFSAKILSSLRFPLIRCMSNIKRVADINKGFKIVIPSLNVPGSTQVERPKGILNVITS